jgi:hypothetical protein
MQQKRHRIARLHKKGAHIQELPFNPTTGEIGPVYNDGLA